jgi:hypothetical protein
MNQRWENDTQENGKRRTTLPSSIRSAREFESNRMSFEVKKLIVSGHQTERNEFRCCCVEKNIAGKGCIEPHTIATALQQTFSSHFFIAQYDFPSDFGRRLLHLFLNYFE